MKKVLYFVLMLASGVTWAAEPTVPAGVLLFDNQAYTIPAGYDNDILASVQSAGWSDVKACNEQADVTYPPTTCASVGNPNGFFYTVTSTPGIDRTIPGNGKALAVEGWDATLSGQSDLYLQYGTDGDSVGKVPGDVWFQYWMLAETDPSWYTGFNQPKLIYPIKDSYPCSSSALCDWVLQNGDYSFNPIQLEEHGRMFYSLTGAPSGVFSITGCSTDGTNKPGTVVTDNGFFVSGEWYLIRQHFNTSQTAVLAGTHLWETYARKYGDANFTLVSRWQNNADYAPDGGGCTFTWAVDNTLGYGHKAFRIPTTMGKSVAPYLNSRYYIKDFAVAAGTDSGGNGVSDLPYGYGDAAADVDVIPDNFSFADNTGVARSTVIYSISIAVAGIDNTTTLALTGTGCEYSINGAAWATADDNVSLNDTIQMRTTSSASYNTAVSCTLTLNGNISDTWYVTTLAAINDPVAPRMRAGSMTGGWR